MKVTLAVPKVTVGKLHSQHAAVFEVRDQDDTLRGEVHVSTGGVAWRRKNAREGIWLDWDEFIGRLENRP